MSSDSSDDENLSRLREAADSQFINDSMFLQKSTQDEKPLKEKPQTLRNCRDDDEQFNLFHVSPQFRGYVAKHLTRILDQQLRKRLRDEKKKCKGPKAHSGGVRLLKCSTNFVEVANNLTFNKKIVVHDKDTVDNEMQCKSVAVSPADILSQKDTKCWSNRSKAPVYRYIKTHEGLVLT